MIDGIPFRLGGILTHDVDVCNQLYSPSMVLKEECRSPMLISRAMLRGLAAQVRKKETELISSTDLYI